MHEDVLIFVLALVAVYFIAQEYAPVSLVPLGLSLEVAFPLYDLI
jgi:hypothetical protein